MCDLFGTATISSGKSLFKLSRPEGCFFVAIMFGEDEVVYRMA